ncbi:WD40 repeat domain-containing protein [Candidatus Poribacteria bacterium]|nr:WD40 repeat domain-containing protein [Candidatus Poribacteria bacterium]
MKHTNSKQEYLSENVIASYKIGKDGENYWCRDIQFSSDGTQLAVIANSWFDTSNIKEIRIYNTSVSEEIKACIRPNDEQTSIAFSPDGKKLVSGGDNKVVNLWDVDTGKLLKTFIGHTQKINGVVFSPDGHTVASGSQDGTVRFWDIFNASHKYQQLIAPITSIEFSNDGTILAAGVEFSREWMSGYSIYLWDVVNYNFLGSRMVHVGRSWGVNRATISPDIKTLATQMYGPVVFLWDIESGGFKDSIEGDRYQYGCSPTCVAFSPDGKFLATGGGAYPCDRSPPDQSIDNTVYLWDLNNYETIAKLKGHTRIVESIAFSPDGSILASVDRGGIVLLWDIYSIENNNTEEKPEKKSI